MTGIALLPLPQNHVNINSSVKLTGKENILSGKSFERAERESHIVMVFVNNYKTGGLSELTAVQVARALMLEPSWHVRKLLASCVAKGYLEMRGEGDARCNNLPETEGKKYWYKLSAAKVHEIESAARDIPLKINGVTAGQLRMF